MATHFVDHGVRLHIADTTKLLSGDSRVSGLVHPQTLHGGREDPNSSKDFRDLVDAIANRTYLDFRPPRYPPERPGPLYLAWKQVADLCRDKVPPPNPTAPDELATSSTGADAAEASLPFRLYMVEPDRAQRIVSWLRFQLLTPDLQILFWKNNNEEDLLEAREALMSTVGPELISVILPEMKLHGLSGYGYAEGQLKDRDWIPPTFALAYTFWAFIKGFRLSFGLSDVHVWTAHWLRERAASDAGKGSPEERADLDVPWGYLLESALRAWPAKLDLGDLTMTLTNLRKHTLASVEAADTYDLRHEFLVLGLEAALRDLGYPRGRKSALSIVGQAAARMAEDEGPGGALASYVVRMLTKVAPDSRTRRARLLISNNMPYVRRFLETGHRCDPRQPRRA